MDTVLIPKGGVRERLEPVGRGMAGQLGGAHVDSVDCRGGHWDCTDRSAWVLCVAHCRLRAPRCIEGAAPPPLLRGHAIARKDTSSK